MKRTISLLFCALLIMSSAALALSSDLIKPTVLMNGCYSGEYTFRIGDSLSACGGKTVKLINVGTSNAVVDVDGTSKSIARGATNVVNGVEVTVVSVVSRTLASDSSAVLKLKCAAPAISPRKSLWARLTGRFFSLF